MKLVPEILDCVRQAVAMTNKNAFDSFQAIYRQFSVEARAHKSHVTLVVTLKSDWEDLERQLLFEGITKCVQTHTVRTDLKVDVNAWRITLTWPVLIGEAA